jgi:hypothetical protein
MASWRLRFRWIVGVALAGGCWVSAAWASTDVDRLLDKLVQKGLLTPEEAAEVRRDTAEPAPVVEARAAEPAPEAAPDWVRRIRWFGDLRVREESFWRDGSPDRHRGRFRLRLGAAARISDQLEAGARLAAGTNLDPIGTNQSFQDKFDKKDVFIDQAYLKLSTAGLAGFEALPLAVWAGKFENPLHYTALTWDADLTPEGLAASVTPAWGPVRFFATGGLFPIDELDADAEDPLLFVAQAGAAWSVAKEAGAEWLRHLTIKSALGYYDYKNLKSGLETTSSNRFGNTALGTSSAGTTFLQHDYDELNVLTEVGSRLLGQPVAFVVDFVKNTAVAKHDSGFQVGLRAGKADRPLAWEAGYFWQRLEADAVVGPFTDSDFGEGGTGRHGHVFRVALGALKHSTVAAKLALTEAIAGEDSAIDRFQLDWETKF